MEPIKWIKTTQEYRDYEKENGFFWGVSAGRVADYMKRYVEEVVKNNDVLDIVSEMFDFAGYLYGNFDYHDNTKDGDIYIYECNAEGSFEHIWSYRLSQIEAIDFIAAGDFDGKFWFISDPV